MQEISKTLVDGSATLAASTGTLTVIFKMFDHYAAGIGAICTLVFGIIYIIFQFLAHKKLTLADKNQRDLAEFEQETKKEFKAINSGIDNILNKLNN